MRGGWLLGIVEWAELHPNLSLGIVLGIVGLVVAILVIRDARKRVRGICEIDDIVLEMFRVALSKAKAKANTINFDAQWDKDMKRMGKHIMGIDAIRYSGKDMTDRREIAKIGKEVRKVAPTDEDAASISKLIASTMVNRGYGIEESDLEGNKKYDKLKQRLGELRRVPSKQINDAINKCLDYVYALSNLYIYHLVRMKNTEGLGEQTLAEMRNFIRDQENNTGDISECLTELRIEIDKFTRGEKSAKAD